MNKRAIVIVVTTLILGGVSVGLLMTYVGRTNNYSGARSSSVNNLKQIGLACQSYNDTLGFLPHNGGADPEKLKDINYGWHNPKVRDSGTWATQILPFMEADAAFHNNLIEAASVNEIPEWFRSAENKKHWQVTIRNYNCPGRGRAGFKTNMSPGNYPGIVTDYAINVFLNSPPTRYNNHGFALDGGLAVAGNAKLNLEKIPDGSANTILVGGKALPPMRANDNKASNGDEGIFSPGHYDVEAEKTVVHSTGTGRGHPISAQPPEADVGMKSIQDGSPWMYRDTELVNSIPADWAQHWGGSFSGGVLFLMADGTVRSINYNLRGTVNFALMLYPGDGKKVEFD